MYSQEMSVHIFFSSMGDGSSVLLILIVAEGGVVNFLRVTCLEADSAGTAWNVWSKGTFDRLRGIGYSAGRKRLFSGRGSRSTVEILIDGRQLLFQTWDAHQTAWTSTRPSKRKRMEI